MCHCTPDDQQATLPLLAGCRVANLWGFSPLRHIAASKVLSDPSELLA